MTRRSRGAATAWCGCAPATSSASKATLKLTLKPALKLTWRELCWRNADSRTENARDANREPAAARVQARLHGLHGGAAAGLLVLLRADQFSLFLRRLADHLAGRHLA